MTFISLVISKVSESKDEAVYAFGNPPHNVFGNVKINKISGEIELIDIQKGKSRKRFLPYVESALKEHFLRGEFPENTSYHA